MTVIAVPPARLPRWLDNFSDRHGETTLGIEDGALAGHATDGSSFTAHLPFSREYAGPAEVDAFVAAAAAPDDWAMLLVRKGGFAVARLRGGQTVESKVGQRHVQGRTKAGGQSQQRFARRRDNQARAAYEAAAEHAARLISDAAGVVVGGDATAVGVVLEDSRLRALSGRIIGPFLTVPDPRRGVLDAACAQAQTITIDVRNA